MELFKAFDERITPAKTEWEAAVARLLDCAQALTSFYYPTAGGSHLTVIGSLSKETTVTPINDVDGVFRLPPGTYQKFDDYTSNGQSALLQEVRGVLAKRYPLTRIRGDGPVVVVEFTTGPNVEIVPGVLVHDGADMLHASCWVPVTRNGGSWEHADYGAEIDNVTRLNASTSGQFSRLIRYMKEWRTAHGASLKSIVIELMAAEFMRSWPSNSHGYSFDDWLVRDFLAYAARNYTSTYHLPSGKQVDTGSGWLLAVQNSHKDAVTACDYGEDSPVYLTYWKKVLGHGFGS